ncbi:hypothetical protein OD350_28660 (plasmid) [Clostridium beijerinckii]|uniref:hypothetical protein n=1 Tax=Clostridium beijerinckii TaxID=1520 RepID=UPI00222636B7|nr:hypothetical protein [Clostridium beijerinckii]UYZ39046.1 hypothetical protein OD350_28660 [Clostridium beijerinckii]
MKERFLLIIEIIMDMDPEGREVLIAITLILAQVVVYGSIVYFLKLSLQFWGLMIGISFSITGLLLKLK